MVIIFEVYNVFPGYFTALLQFTGGPGEFYAPVFTILATHHPRTQSIHPHHVTTPHHPRDAPTLMPRGLLLGLAYHTLGRSR